jgi:hypothetical protein
LGRIRPKAEAVRVWFALADQVVDFDDVLLQQRHKLMSDYRVLLQNSRAFADGACP